MRQELAGIAAASLEEFRKQCVKQLFKKKLVRGKLCAIDGTGDGTGLKDRYRVVGLLNVHQDRALWLSWRVLAGDASEKGKEASVVHSMVEEVREAGGPEAIQWLLMDALYADGPLLAWLEYGCGIHALVRLPEDRLLYADLKGLAEGGLVPWERHTDVRYVKGHKQMRQVSLAMAQELTSWDSFCQAAAQYQVAQPALWGCLLRTLDLEVPTVPTKEEEWEEEWALVSTHPFPSGWASGWAAYRQWRQRWRVENTGFGELKEGWHLECAPWSYSQEVVIAARVAFTLVAFW